MTCPALVLGALLAVIGIIAHLRSLHHRGVRIDLPANVRNRNGYNRQDALAMFDESEEVS